MVIFVLLALIHRKAVCNVLQVLYALLVIKITIYRVGLVIVVPP